MAAAASDASDSRRRDASGLVRRTKPPLLQAEARAAGSELRDGAKWNGDAGPVCSSDSSDVVSTAAGARRAECAESARRVTVTPCHAASSGGE